MRRINSSTASLVVASIALFVALGGTAVAFSQIGTSQIKNSAVTSSKLHKGAVTSSKIASSAVTTSKIANAAVTASQVAPNTFLPINGTAANSARLGGLLPADFLQGVGAEFDRRLVVPVGSNEDLGGSVGFGGFLANCSASDQPSVTWTPTVSNAQYMAQVLVFGQTPTLDEENSIAAGQPFTEPATLSVAPFAITYQIGYTDAQSIDHIATIYVTGRFMNGVGCAFLAQGVTTA
jgi:hypothetical protein